MSKLRVRFAPSPTGYLHVGGARTALFNYLYARKSGGVFVLRIEDTDKERSTDENTKQILDSMRWLGLEWDEGPHLQSEGLDRHRGAALRLLDEGKAYRCFCPPELIERKRQLASDHGAGWQYDRTSLSISPERSLEMAAAGVPFCVRFLVPEGETTFKDMVHGRTTLKHDDMEDFVLLRSDGSPTYHLSVVCDDVQMGITHVVRGDDHISNTPKQILLYKALGAEPPIFAHLPLILGPDKKRLSKRHGATAVMAYQQQGILASAMVNFLGLLGWNPKGDREIMTLAEMVEAFDFSGVGSSAAVFDTEKLLWMSGKHMERTAAAELLPLIEDQLGGRGLWTPGDRDPARLARVEAMIDLSKIRQRTLPDLARDVARYLSDDVEIEEDARRKHLAGDDLAARLQALRDALAGCADWTPAELETAVRGAAEKLGVSAAKLIHPARVAALGVAVSPGIFDVLAAIGRESTMKRVEALVAATARA